MQREEVDWRGWPILEYSARTAVAALASVLAAGLFRLTETYWAAITTGDHAVIAWFGAHVSRQRFVGTSL